jgi:hypothetical protein
MILREPQAHERLLCAQEVESDGDVARARQSLASKGVPKQELGDEIDSLSTAHH